EQRRLARPSYQLDALDAFVGEEQLRLRADLRAAWRELGAARRRHEKLSGNAAAEEARLAELRPLVEDTAGLTADAEDALRGARGAGAGEGGGGGGRWGGRGTRARRR